VSVQKDELLAWWQHLLESLHEKQKRALIMNSSASTKKISIQAYPGNNAAEA